MSLYEWLQKLSSQTITCSASEALNNVLIVAKRLELIPFSNNVITVAGTNGKGSVIAALSTIYFKAGYKVASFTSPHLFRFNERISLNGNPVSDEQILEAFIAIKRELSDINLTYFQYSFLAALYIFKITKPDIVLLEVGIGGGRDCVNLVDPILSIITSIDLDHCELLGKTREFIALEKAGIMRPGKFVVCVDPNPPKSLIAKAKELSVKYYGLNRDFKYIEAGRYWNFYFDDFVIDSLINTGIRKENISAAIMVVQLLKNVYPVSIESIYKALGKIDIIGRCQLIKYYNKKILFDVSHNPSAVLNLLNYIKKIRLKGKCFAIVNIRQDKDVRAMILPMLLYCKFWIVLDLNISDMFPAVKLAKQLKAMGADSVLCYSNIDLALQKSLSLMDSQDLLVVFGSFHTVSAVMRKFKEEDF